MRAVSFIVVGLVLGGFVGYMVGVLVFCMILGPDKPQCGLVAVFVTGPAGAILGAIIGTVLSFRRRP
ncbi:MAG TPA: hypothetical protein VFA18_20575 [Gemmataceae bacterium]|nr:hypothetical protein [Gemmataceae bacterium]